MRPMELHQCHWESASLMGEPGIYTEARVKEETVPEGLRIYYLRHGDSDWSEPVMYQDHPVLVNYFGTFLTKAELKMEEDHEWWFEPEDWVDGYANPYAPIDNQPVWDIITKSVLDDLKKEVAK